MTRRLLESLSGVGTIHTGDVLLRTTSYALFVWLDDQPLDPADHGKMITAIEGHIDITGMAEAVVLAGPALLTLTLADGRRLAFHLTGSSGSIVGQGWLA